MSQFPWNQQRTIEKTEEPKPVNLSELCQRERCMNRATEPKDYQPCLCSDHWNQLEPLKQSYLLFASKTALQSQLRLWEIARKLR